MFFLRFVEMVRLFPSETQITFKIHPQIGNHRQRSLCPGILTTPVLADWQIGDAVIRPRWRVSVGTMDATLQTCLAGFGIARLPAFIAQKEMDAGRLVRVLPDEDVPKIPMTLLRPRGVPTLAVTAFIKHLYVDLR